uniref:Uncharacterized protein n=1 Tax=Glossina pallidipes TaxID=7398 RepID=A0A1B0A7N5_GLOPL
MLLSGERRGIRISSASLTACVNFISSSILSSIILMAMFTCRLLPVTVMQRLFTLFRPDSTETLAKEMRQISCIASPQRPIILPQTSCDFILAPLRPAIKERVVKHKFRELAEHSPVTKFIKNLLLNEIYFYNKRVLFWEGPDVGYRWALSKINLNNTPVSELEEVFFPRIKTL